MNIIKRIFTQRPLPLFWIVAIAYALIGPMALLIPADVFILYPWTSDFTDAIASVIPMINRVVVYGHPHPEKLRCFLAYAWCCVPVLMWVQHRYHEKYNKPLAGGPGIFGFWIRWTAAITLVVGICFLIWYWPNFPGAGKGVLAPIARPHDERRQLVWSTTSLFLCTPLWLIGFVSMFDFFRCELLNFLWRIGILKAYPSPLPISDSSPTLKYLPRHD
jgi:hypothetical protein